MKEAIKKHWLLVIISLLVFVPVVVKAINTVDSGFCTDSNETQIVDAHSVCKKVTNNNNLSIFIPTKISVEWQAFRDNALNVLLEECCVADMGDSCGESVCVNPGIIVCDGSCEGATNKPDGTSCPGGSCQNGNCCECSGTGSICGGNYICTCNGCIYNCHTFCPDGCSGGVCNDAPEECVPPDSTCDVDEHCPGAGDFCGWPAHIIGCGWTQNSCGKWVKICLCL